MGIYDTFVGCEKEQNNLILLCLYKTTDTYDGKLFELNPTTNSWNNFSTLTFNQANESVNNFYCTSDYNNYCYYSTYLINTTFSVYKIDTSSKTINYLTNTPTLGGDIMKSNKNLMTKGYPLGIIYEFNGVTWNSRLIYPGWGYGMQEIYIDVTTKFLIHSQWYLGFYDIYSTTFSYPIGSHIGLIDGSSATKQGMSIINNKAWIIQQAKLSKFDYNNLTSQEDISTTTIMRCIDYSISTGRAWAAGNSGYIYYNNFSGTSEGTYSLSARVSNNPVSYGISTNFYATPSNTYAGQASNISIVFLNSTGDWVYGWDWIGARDGIEQSNDISSISWLNFPVGVYHVMLNSTPDGYDYAFADFYWNVTGTATNTTIINYTWNENNISGAGTCFFNVKSYGEQNSYAMGNNGSEIEIYSINHNDPSNIIFKNTS